MFKFRNPFRATPKIDTLPGDELPGRDPFALDASPAPAAAPAVEERPKAARSREVKASRQRRSDYEVVTQATQLRYITHRKVLVSGHALFATLDASKEAPSAGFVEQAPRQTVPAARAMLGKKAPLLRVAVDGRLLEKSRTRYALALDGYLAWGKRNGSGTTVVMGGGEDAGCTYLELYVFRDRALVEYLERELPSPAEPAFAVMLQTLLDELASNYEGVRVFAAAPLPDWQIPEVEYLGDKPLRGLSFVPLSTKASTAPGSKPFVLVAGAGLLAYAAMVGAGWHLYNKAGQDYDSEASDPALAESGQINNARLEVMQQQRMFMEAERPQVDMAKRSSRIVNGIASIRDVRIADLKFHGAATAGADAAAGAAPTADPAAGPAPDVSMEIIVPTSDSAAVDQAKVLLNAMSARTGLVLRLTPGGWTTDTEAGTRTYRIEGFIK